MKNVAIVVSDLHMGFNPRMDNFAGDAKFSKFCERVASFVEKKQLDLTFVLAGDILEMWEMAPDDETDPTTPAQRIADNLFFPAVGQTAEAAATARGRWQIDQALQKHTVFTEGLAEVLAIGARLVYLPGNHDHAMVNPALQEHFRTRLEEATGTALGGDRLTFAHFCEIPELKLYAEHGHQFADGDSSYEDVTDWTREAPGYYFLRFVYSRLEGLPAMHVPLGELVRIILNLIFHPQVIDHDVKRYLYEYFAAHESIGFPLAQGPSVPFVGRILPAIFEHWKAHGRPLDAGSETLARECRELAARTQLEQTDGTPEHVEDLASHNIRRTSTGLPGRLLNYMSTHARDRYAMGMRDRFARETAPFPRLTPVDGMTVIAGHTHREHHSRLLDAFMATVRYMNSGSWSAGPKRTSYCAVTDHPNVFRNRLLYIYR
jgi:UDP-2,3-diacylglucosamine pyrophosphatase LpxH